MRASRTKLLLPILVASAFLALSIFSAVTAQATLITNSDSNTPGLYGILLGQSFKLQVASGGFSPGDVLLQMNITAPQLGWTSYTGSFAVPKTSDTLAHIFTASAFGELIGGIGRLDDLDKGDLNPVPEPSLFLLVGTGILGMRFLIRRLRLRAS